MANNQPVPAVRRGRERGDDDDESSNEESQLLAQQAILMLMMETVLGESMWLPIPFFGMASTINDESAYAIVFDFIETVSPQHIVFELRSPPGIMESMLETLASEGRGNWQVVVDGFGASFWEGFGRIHGVEAIEVNLEAQTLPLATAILGAFNQVNSVKVSYYGDGYDNIRDAETQMVNRLAENPTLREGFFHVNDEISFYTLTRGLATMTNLKACIFEGSLGDEQQGDESDDESSPSTPPLLLEDADAAPAIFLNKSLQFLIFNNFQLGNEKVAIAVSNALKEANIEDLVLRDVSVPTGMEANLAIALIHTDSALKHVTVADYEVIVTMGQRMNRFHTIDSLRLGFPDRCMESQFLASVFRSALSWKIESIHLCIHDWTTEFDEALAEFVSVNDHLQSLSITMSPEFDGPRIAPPLLLKAIDEGAPVLRCFHVSVGFDDETDDPSCVCSHWLARVHYFLEFHSQRRRYASQFHKLVSTKTVLRERRRGLVLFIKLFSQDFLFELLKRDQWGMRTHLLEDCPRDV